MPVTTFLTTVIDLMNALTPTPGRFDEGGHDYRAAIPEGRSGGCPQPTSRCVA
jgi:hypothetical protein